ncbi:hypothetical protein CANCADRAFT_1528 [Tortispora caseinolytica NRRL Y-17796]|uniref:Uncharacterized protein n=1 Tax=Tortispora caseinolytica NRRL Y-17796 TaxID=767744 RepID=A0A1E4TME3_9ASCO|nr:hypothetical protein CANCADRAFT_1528 [Tortispora caseinolytica NRRL Y-17796]
MSDDGAGLGEILCEAARRDNTDLLEEVFGEADDVAQLINTSRNPIGLSAIHLAAKYGALSALDMLLDQPGVEVDPIEPIEGNTPLHLAVDAANTNPEEGTAAVELLVQAGSNIRIKNKHAQKPIDIAYPTSEGVRKILQDAEMAILLGSGPSAPPPPPPAAEGDDEDAGTPSESESD